MHELTNEEAERFTDVMYEKYHWQLDMFPTRAESLRGIIQGVVADTHLLDLGVVTLERWEEAAKETTT